MQSYLRAGHPQPQTPQGRAMEVRQELKGSQGSRSEAPAPSHAVKWDSFGHNFKQKKGVCCEETGYLQELEERNVAGPPASLILFPSPPHLSPLPISVSPLHPPHLCFSLCLGSISLSFQSDILHMEGNMAADTFQVFLLRLPLTDVVPRTKTLVWDSRALLGPGL